MLVYIAIALFLLGAVGGLVMATQSFRSQQPSPVLTVGHGVLVATGLVLLIISFLLGSLLAVQKIGLLLLVIAALGGFFLLSFHMRKQNHPRAIIVVHALLAVVGVALLLAGTVLPA